MAKREFLFVYGTLREPPYRNLMGDCLFVDRATVKGKLYLVEGTYPGYVEGEGLVFGEIYSVDERQFGKLDEYEGELYVRRKIQTSSHMTCWIYEFKGREV